MKNTILFLLLLSPFLAHSQSLFDQDNRIIVQGGIDPATMITFRYERLIRGGLWNKDIYPFAEVSSSVTRFGVKNSAMKIGQRMPVVSLQSFQLITGLNTSFGSVETINSDSRRLALEGDVALGYYRRKWFFAMTASYEKILATKLIHSGYYRARFYDAAIDGWYTGAGGSFQFGIEGGVVIKNTIEVFLELKVPLTERFNPMMGSPAHANVGVGYRF